MILLAFPSKYEAEELLKLMKPCQRKDVAGVECYSGQLNGVDLLVPIIGMGLGPAGNNTRKVLENEAVGFAILAGFAGGLNESLERGQVVVAQNYSGAEAVNFVRLLPGFDLARLHTSEDVVTTAAGKARLAVETGCQMVDMEAKVFVSIARQYGIDTFVVRAISDLVSEDLPGDVLAKSVNKATGMPDAKGLSLFLLTHPHRVGAFRNFLKPLPEVRSKLTAFLVPLIKEFGSAF